MQTLRHQLKVLLVLAGVGLMTIILSGCGLIAAPFRVAGAVAEATAKTTGNLVTYPFTDRRTLEEKQMDALREEAEKMEQEQEALAASAKPAETPTPEGGVSPTGLPTSPSGLSISSSVKE